MRRLKSLLFVLGLVCAGGAAEGASGETPTGSEVCDAYVDCAAETDPATLADACVAANAYFLDDWDEMEIEDVDPVEGTLRILAGVVYEDYFDCTAEGRSFECRGEFNDTGAGDLQVRLDGRGDDDGAPAVGDFTLEGNGECYAVGTFEASRDGSADRKNEPRIPSIPLPLPSGRGHGVTGARRGAFSAPRTRLRSRSRVFTPSGRGPRRRDRAGQPRLARLGDVDDEALDGLARRALAASGFSGGGLGTTSARHAAFPASADGEKRRWMPVPCRSKAQVR